MKKFLLSSIFLFSLAYGVIACTEGLPTDNWEEPVVPVDPAVTTLRGSFESKFVRYSKGSATRSSDGRSEDRHPLERHPLAERPYTQTDSVMVRR